LLFFKLIINEVIARKNNITLVACLIERRNTGDKINAVLNIVLGTHIKKRKVVIKRVLSLNSVIF